MFRWIENKLKIFFSKFKKVKPQVLLTSTPQTTITTRLGYSNIGAGGTSYILNGYSGQYSNSIVYLTNLQLEETALQEIGLGPKKGYFDKDGNYHYSDLNYWYNLYNQYYNIQSQQFGSYGGLQAQNVYQNQTYLQQGLAAQQNYQAQQQFQSQAYNQVIQYSGIAPQILPIKIP